MFKALHGICSTSVGKHFSLCPSFTIYMSCIIIVIFLILFSLLKMVTPGFFTCLNCTYPPRASINVTLTRSLPWFYLEAFISHASKLSKDFIYASLTTVITFYFLLYLFPLLAITLSPVSIWAWLTFVFFTMLCIVGAQYIDWSKAIIVEKSPWQ